MIIFNAKNKSFHLKGKTYSYMFFVNRAGYLQSVHMGAAAEDDGYLFGVYSKNVSPDPDSINGCITLDDMPSEYAFFGHGDFREPSAVIRQTDGSYVSDFRYLSHRVYKGVPEVEGMPHAREGGETLEIVLKDELSPVQLVLNYTVFDEYDVLVRNAVFKNTGNPPVYLDKAFSFCCSLKEGEYDMLRLYGSWGAERIPETVPLGHGVQKIHSARGASSHQCNPFTAIMEKGCSEESGNCIGVALVYSGSWAISSERTKNGAIRVHGGISDIGFCWKLGAGESFVTPQTAVCVSCAGLGHMSREFADFIRDNIMPPRYSKASRPVLINNWEGTYFTFDTEKLCNMIKAVKGVGLDMFVLDDGWFGKRDDDKSGLGDWYVNMNKLKGGLKPVIDCCKENGLKFGLWFEPEMVCEDSDLYRAHPDWAIKREGYTPVRSRNQLVLDFSRKEVVDYIYNLISKVLKENDISYVKWDMNRNITEFYSSALPADRQGELVHRYILGVYDLAERLTSEFPDIMFEGCAGGGGRFDAGALYYFPQIWTSDDTDGFERTKIQWGTSMVYPVSSHSCHVSACPNHQTRRITPFETRAGIASLGATGYELDPTKLTAEEVSGMKEWIKNYKSVEDIILKGDLYRLSSPLTTNYFCEMIVTKDKERAYVVGERFHGEPCDFDRIIKLCGLDLNKKYKIEELDITASGSSLVNAGVLLPRLPDFSGWVWHINEVK